MRLSRPLPTSPRRSSSKQLKIISSLELNSYKIDTSSLSQKAKQIQQLKTSLQTQISQYKASQSMFHEEIQKLSQQNNELRKKVKKIQTEFKKIKQEQPNSPLLKSKSPSKNNENQIKLLKITIASLQDQVASLKNKLAKKNQEIIESQEYKKMYDIQVENKNNIMNFYQNKLALFKKDKGVLISRYQDKISQLGSGLEVNNGTMTNFQQGYLPPNMTTTMPNGIKKDNKTTQEYFTQKNITGVTKDKIQQKSPSQKIIRFIRPSKPSNNIKESKHYEDKEKSQSKYEQETPYKMLQASSTHESRNKQNTPYSNKSIKNELQQISVSSSATGRDDMLVSRDAKVKQSPKKNTKNLAQTSKKLRSDDLFLQFIKKVTSNLRRQNIKSENLKNLAPVRNFLSIVCPLPSQAIDLLQKFPFGPIEMDKLALESCVQKMRNHLHKRYSTWSGSLLIELLIDKIEDVEIAYEVNSEEDDIVAGLSSEEENN